MSEGNVYKGWIPTVGKRLSFSVDNTAGSPKTVKCVNIVDSTHRVVIGYQKRWLSDSAVPFFREFLTKHLLKLDGDFWFVMVGINEKSCHKMHEPMKGKVFLIERRQNWEKVRSDIEALMEALEKLDGNEGLFTSIGPIQDRFQINALQSLYCVDYVIYRNGICEIFPDKKGRALNDSSRNTLRVELIKDDKMELVVCSQVFFFIKDMWHVHQHHHSKTDTLVDLHHAPDNLSWMSNTLRALYKKVIDYKRVRSDEINFSSSGIMAYVQTFLSICKEDLGEDYHKLPIRDNENLLKSIWSSEESRKINVLRKKRFVDILIASIIGAAGVCFAVSSAMVLTIVGNDKESVIDLWPAILAMYVIERPWVPTVIFVALISALMVYDETFRWRESFPNTRRLLNIFSARTHAILLAFFACFVLVLTYLVVTNPRIITMPARYLVGLF